MKRWGLLLVTALALAPAAQGCAEREEAGTVCAEAEGKRVVDPALLGFLSRARAAHRVADQHEDDENRTAAIDALQKLVDGPVPGSGQAPVEAREVLADTRARLAELKSADGRYDDALKDVSAGLALVSERNYFRGHLFEVRGLVEERHASALKESGDETEAAAARARALDAYETSMEIQAEVIRKSVPEAGP